MSIDIIDKLRDIIPEDADIVHLYDDRERLEILHEAIRVLYYEVRR